MTWKAWTRVAITITLAAAAVAGCSLFGGDDNPAGAGAPAPAPPKTAWEQVLGQIQPDGSMSRQTALAAFSLAVTPLPGAVVPDGLRVEVWSATSAIGAVLSYWDELTPDQQNVIADVLGIRPDQPQPADRLTGAAGRLALQPGHKECQTQDDPKARKFAEIANGLAEDIGERIGIPKDFEVVFSLNPKPQGIGIFGTFTATADCRFASDQPQKYCSIEAYPLGQKDTYPQRLNSLIAHELIHCFQNAYLQLHTLNGRIPAWVYDGHALWGQLQISPIPADMWWNLYLTEPARSLYERTYDAVGVYAHLSDLGINPWSRFKDMLTLAKNAGNAGGWTGLTSGVEQGFLDSWPSGWFRSTPLPAWGMDLTTHTSIPPTTPAIPSASQGSVPAVSTGVMQFDVKTDVVEVEGQFGRIMDSAGSEHLMSAAVGGPFCTLPMTCACPEDSPKAGTVFKPMAPGMLRIAFTGGTQPGTFRLDGMSLEEFCGKACPDRFTGGLQPNECEPAELDECLVGKWVATGVEVDIGGANRASGGRNTVMVIEDSGAGSVDFDASEVITGIIEGPSSGPAGRG